MRPPTLDEFTAELKKLIPRLEVRYKPDSPLMRLISAVLFFNPDFYTHYATTIGNTVYLSSEEWARGDPEGARAVLAHEAVHVYDYGQRPVTFILGYLFPQGLAIFGLLGLFAVLCVTHSMVAAVALILFAATLGLFLVLASRGSFAAAGVFFWLAVSTVLVGALAASPLWGSLSGLALVVPLAPWPSPGRVRAEMRGYTMTLAVSWWAAQNLTPSFQVWVASHFLDWTYYRMSWSMADIAARIQAAVASIKDGSLARTDPVFGRVFELLGGRGV